MWDYAALSKLVSEFGGPELFVKAMRSSGRHQGIAIGCGCTLAAVALVAYGMRMHRNNKEIDAMASKVDEIISHLSDKE